ncbi:MAG: pyridoxal phosphate-dependent aminotransferase [Candidatus Sulfotelmatobacter sp.]
MFSERTNWKLARNRLTAAVEAALARRVRLLDLTASNPTRIGLRYDSASILGTLGSERAMDYDPQSKGLLSAREAVASYYRNILARGRREVASNVSTVANPDRIVLTTSTSEGYSFVFRLLCNGGDELLVPKPSYPLFEFLADLQDVRLVPYPLIYDHGWQMDFHSLEKAVTERTRGVVIVHPNNPTGSYVQLGELAPLNAFCRAHGLALIVDEVFLDYALDGREHASFAENREVLTFTLSGLSKISALPQMKVAWVVTTGPENEVREAIDRLEVIADTYLSMNAPIQWAIPTLLEQRSGVQQQLQERVKNNLAELDRQLAQQKACERLGVEGGWYAVLRVPVTRSDEELAIELVREKSVLVHPGHFYDFPSDGYLVLSLIAEEQDFREGIVRVLDTLNS